MVVDHEVLGHQAWGADRAMGDLQLGHFQASEEGRAGAAPRPQRLQASGAALAKGGPLPRRAEATPGPLVNPLRDPLLLDGGPTPNV